MSLAITRWSGPDRDKEKAVKMPVPNIEGLDFPARRYEAKKLSIRLRYQARRRGFELKTSLQEDGYVLCWVIPGRARKGKRNA